MGGIDYLDLTLHDILHRQPLIIKTENPLGQSAFGVDVNQQEAYSQPHERSMRYDPLRHSTHTLLNADLVDLVNGEALVMRNVECASGQMDVDTKGVPEPLDRQPMPTLTSDDPYLYPPEPAPDGGIGETVTMSLSPPRHANRPRSRLDRLVEMENGSESEESEGSSSEESTSSTEAYPIPVHPISGGGEWTMLPDIFPLQFPPSPSDDIRPSTDRPTRFTGCTRLALRPKRKVTSLRRANLISGRTSVVREERFGTVPKGGAKMEPLPWSSQQPNPEKLQTEPVLSTQYHLIEDIPVVLPRVPSSITRARRLLLPSHESQPIAWVSMRGDTQWVDPERR